MVCPRCGGTLEFYELGDAETKACQDCIYVGIAVDHTSEGERPESWDDALSRFYEKHGTVPDEAKVRPVFEPPAAAGAGDPEADEEPDDAKTDSGADDRPAESPDAG